MTPKGGALRGVPQRARLAMYRHPGATAAARRVLNAGFGLVAPRGPRVRRILAGPLRGTRMAIALATEEKRYWLDLYEPWVQDQLREHVSPGDAAWDVGAYVGYHALLLDVLGARVTAFEPDPENRRRLEHNLALNGAQGRVTVVPTAVGERAGTLYMQAHGTEPAQNRVDVTGDIAVPVATLDELLDAHGLPSLVKMDVEGSEAAAFRGGRRVLDEVRPVWVMELHGDEGLEATRRLLDGGYRLVVPDERVGVAEVLATRGRAHAVAVPG